MVKLRLSLIAAVALLALPASATADTYETPPDDPSGLPPLQGVNDPNPPPTVTGTPQVGGELTGTLGNWEAGVSLSSRWLRCNPAANFCAPTGDTDLNYSVTAADQGAVMMLRVAGTRTNPIPPGGSLTRFADAVSNPITAAPALPIGPRNLIAPTITGTAREGQTLRAVLGQWTGTDPISYAYSWASCAGAACRAVSTGSSYRVPAADVGRRLLLAVTARNGIGSANAFVPTGTVTGSITRLKRLSPFPLLLIDGRVAGAITSISTLRLRRVPGGATVAATCKGRGCPFRKSTVKVRKGKSRTVKLRRLQRRMRAGTTVVITVRKGNTLGKYIRLRFRRGSAPARLDRCVAPKSSKPIKCP